MKDFVDIHPAAAAAGEIPSDRIEALLVGDQWFEGILSIVYESGILWWKVRGLPNDVEYAAPLSQLVLVRLKQGTS